MATGVYTTKELYGKISAGEFDPVTLSNIKYKTNQIFNGKSDIKRFNAEANQGLLRGGEALCSAALVCRADESTGTTHPRGSYEGEKECGNRQERLLETWARKTDNWIDLVNLDPDMLISSGGESEVYRYDGKTVLKVNTLRYTVSPQLLIDRLVIHNTLFPETACELLGFGRNAFGEFCFAYTQRFVIGDKPTPRQMEEFISSIGGAEPYGENGGMNFKTPDLLLDDLHEENIIVERGTGRLLVIDSDIRYNTPELGLGGRYIIPPIEEDFIENSKSKEMSENIPKNIVHLEGAVRACEVTDTENGRIARIHLATAAKTDMEGVNGTLIHRVAFRLSDNDPGGFAALARNKGMKDGRPALLSVNGVISSDRDGLPYVKTTEQQVKGIGRISAKSNRTTFDGKVVETYCTPTHATVMLKFDDSTLIPIMLRRKDNPAQYEEINREGLKKGESLQVNGTLVSRYYLKDQANVYRCHIRTKQYRKLNVKVSEKKSRKID